MRKLLMILVLVALGAAYVAGYWPQHQQLRVAQQSEEQVREQLAGVQAVARICRLENGLLALLGQLENQNYGEAQKLSNSFFDDLRREADRDQGTAYKQDLENLLNQRDSVTAGLAKGDASISVVLRQSLTQIQQLIQKLASQANLG